MTVVAPAARAVCMHSSPMGPAPRTRTESPNLMSDKRTAWTVTAQGSHRAACSSVTSSGTGRGFPFVEQDELGIALGPRVLLEPHGAVVEAGVRTRRRASAWRRVTAATDDAITDAPTADVRPDIDDGSGVFVTHDRAGLGEVVHEGVDVGAADGRILHAHHDLIGTGRGVWQLLDLQYLLTLVNGSAHGVIPPVLRGGGRIAHAGRANGRTREVPRVSVMIL